MTSLSAHDVVDATGIKILLIGTTWMLDPGTAAFGGEIGLPGRSFWAVGRGGVLGAVDADVWWPPSGSSTPRRWCRCGTADRP
ncbi:MAG: hypothetical protein AB7W59_27405, partial [Acidimicrobiia bacterium]